MKQRPSYYMQTGRTIIGECKKAKDHITYQLWFDTEQEAQRLANTITDIKGWSSYKIIFLQRKTTYHLANCHPWKKRISMYPLGQTVGTLLHELAHEKSYRHDREFKCAHTQLLSLWEKHLRRKGETLL